jgi:hypothetical protein
MGRVEERLHTQITALTAEVSVLEESIKVRKGTLTMLQSIVEVAQELRPKVEHSKQKHNSLTHTLLEIFSMVKDPLTISQLKERLVGMFPARKLNGNIYSTLSVLMHEGKLRRVGTGTYQSLEPATV